MLSGQKLYRRSFGLELTFVIKNSKQERCDISEQLEQQMNISDDFDAVKSYKSAAFQKDCKVYCLGATKISFVGQQVADISHKKEKIDSVIGGLDNIIKKLDFLLDPFINDES